MQVQIEMAAFRGAGIVVVIEVFAGACSFDLAGGGIGGVEIAVMVVAAVVMDGGCCGTVVERGRTEEAWQNDSHKDHSYPSSGQTAGQVSDEKSGWGYCLGYSSFQRVSAVRYPLEGER